MSFDFIAIEKDLGQDKICLDYLNHEASYCSGWDKYIYENCKAVEILLNTDARKLRLKGSVPYFMSGQNFKSSPKDFINGIDHLSEVLTTDLMKAEVKVFEFGTTLEIPFSVKEVFNSHLKIQGMKTRSFDYGKYFVDSVMTFKLYDANKNLKNKLNKLERERLTALYNYNPSSNYLKIESHYKKPSISFKTRHLDIAYLTSESFQAVCKDELINKYLSIMKANSINVNSKKQLTTSTIPLLLLKEYESLLPCNLDELIRQKIKSFPDSILTKDDKKSRRRQIKANMKKLESAGTCKYDLSEYLNNQLLSGK